MTWIDLLKKMVRWKDWKDTKLIFFFIFLAVYIPEMSLFNGIYELLIGLIFVCVCLSLGHITNNISDYELDKLTGKHTTKPQITKLFMVILLFLLFLTSIHYVTDYLSLTIIIVSVFLGLSYSVKPIRLKERGFWGIVVGGVSQRVLPLLPIAYFWHILPAVSLYLALLSLISVRQMLIHQIKDYEGDLAGEANTFIVNIGINKGKLILKLISLAETVMLIVWLSSLHSIFVTLVFFGYVCLLIIESLLNTSYWKNLSLYSSSRYFLSDYIFFLLPISVCVFLPYFLIPIYLLMILLFQKYFLFQLINH